MDVVVEVQGASFQLRPDGQPFTFGRDRDACTACLGAEPLDRGISRLAGAVYLDRGLWWIANRSNSRALHVVDVDTGIAVPLPVVRRNWGGNRHPVDRPRLSVLVVGEVMTHALAVTATGDDFPEPEALPELVDPIRTTRLLPNLTDKQRAALAALVEGYLLRFPRYSPEPRTYEEAAERLGLPASTVRKRIEYLRGLLVSAGVAGLESGDARRNLAEWLLSNRLVTSEDLDLLDGPGG